MKFQRSYELNIEEENYSIRHCEVSSQKWIFETKRAFVNFFFKEFYGKGFYIYNFDTSSIIMLEKFTISEGNYLIFVPLEWHEFLNNWLEISSSEEISSEEEEELNKLWKQKFPAFDLYFHYSYYATEAFGALASYLD